MEYMDLQNLYPLLQSVQKPGRYVGGEYGSIVKGGEAPLKIALCFPDLYEIGMSNQAIKLIYQYLNDMDGVLCERVFVPEQDFEEALSNNDFSLYSLESFLPIAEFDILAFSVGYELSITNIFTVLQSSGIPFRNKERLENHPLVIAGGPALTNPLPFSPFIDFVYLGEIESNLKEWIPQLVQAKKNRSKRKNLSGILRDTPGFWYGEKKEKTYCMRWGDFGKSPSFSSGIPVPNVSIVQDQGVVEIMRGCPNKCRFCHAGSFYRPKREKNWREILKEVDFLVHRCGYRTITLSSLSTGDFNRIGDLVHLLNDRYSRYGVSFNLPSLRVNSISLELLSLVSVVRKSGLTFAVEAPTEESQHSLNKDVSTEKITGILKEARKEGWKKAKFYFMLGLPASPEDEKERIIEYLNHLQHNSGMDLHVNIGTFIPKSFTPYSRTVQKTEEESLEEILFIKRNIQNKRIRISFHSPFASFLEGIFSRGEEWAGELALEAYRKGARLDAWEEHLKRDLWKELISSSDRNIVEDICRNNSVQDRLDETISLGIKKSHFAEEFKRSEASVITQACSLPCKEHCGVCNRDLKVIEDTGEEDIPEIKEDSDSEERFHYLISFEKTGRAIYWGHLDIMHIFERSFIRAGLRVAVTQGYNPKPKLEFASPLSLGLYSEEEVFAVEFIGDAEKLNTKLLSLNESLPKGLKIVQTKQLKPQGKIRMMKFHRSSLWRFENLSLNKQKKIREYIDQEGLTDKVHFLSAESNWCVIETYVLNNPIQNPIKLIKAVFGKNLLTEGVFLTRLKVTAERENLQGSFFDIYE